MYDIFIDQANFVINVLIYIKDSPLNLTALNRFSFEDFLKPSATSPERLSTIDLDYKLEDEGFPSQLIDTLPVKKDLMISFVESNANTLGVSKSRVLGFTYKSNGYYEIKQQAENDITIYSKEYVANPTMFTPSKNYAFYLHADSTFYIAPGGSTQPFQSIQIEKIDN